VRDKTITLAETLQFEDKPDIKADFILPMTHQHNPQKNLTSFDQNLSGRKLPIVQG